MKDFSDGVSQERAVKGMSDPKKSYVERKMNILTEENRSREEFSEVEASDIGYLQPLLENLGPSLNSLQLSKSNRVFEGLGQSVFEIGI